MTGEQVEQVMKDLNSSEIPIIVEASDRYKEFKGNIPDSIFQSAFDLYRRLQTQCCLEKSVSQDNFKKLCAAIAQLQNK